MHKDGLRDSPYEKTCFAYMPNQRCKSFLAAEQRLRFRYICSTTISEIWSLYPMYPFSVAKQPVLCRTWSETPNTSFPASRLQRTQCNLVCFQVNALGICQIQFICIHVAACGSVHDVEIILDLCQMFTILRPSQGGYLFPCSPEINSLVPLFPKNRKIAFLCSLFPNIVFVPLFPSKFGLCSPVPLK